MGSPSGSFLEQLKYFTSSFFSNWSNYEASFGKKLALTVKNRSRAVYTLKGCCGNHGEPGC
jgi:hypothetical protein